MADAAMAPARRGRLATLAAFAVVFLALIALGTWQVERLQWKEALIASIEARRTAPPMTMDEARAKVSKGEDIDYAAISATGSFDHNGESYFLATYDGQPGFYVYTPLHMASGEVVFVNRGFVPEALKDPAKRLQGQIDGEVTIAGLARARLAEKPSFLVPENEPQRKLFFWKDMDAMAKIAGVKTANLAPFFIDADATPNPGGYPIGGVTQIDLPNNHLGYAVTWYGLAAALAVITALSFRRKAR